MNTDNTEDCEIWRSIALLLHFTIPIMYCVLLQLQPCRKEMKKVDFVGDLLLITTQKLIYVLGSQQIWK